MAKEKEKPLSNEDMLKLIANKKGKPLTREDLLKLIEENGGTAAGLDLSGKPFEANIDLRKFDLRAIILKEAILVGANLEGAELGSAQLQKAILARVNLHKANLPFAKLQGTFLSDAKLQEAWLFGAELSSDTILGDADWGNYILKDEKEENFAAAAVTYRQLKMWHTNAGMYDTAALFYYREMEAKRKALSWKKEPHLKLWGWIMRLLCGYGEKPYRVVASAATIIFGLAAVYHLWGSFNTSSFSDTLYYSAASFTALGYGRWAPQPIGWAKAMGAAEAFIGVFMMALFLITFVRKMTR